MLRYGRHPFKVVLGENKVVKGWEVALLTMAVGETVALRLAPEFAYGFTGSKGIGSQVTIPPGATLDFKVEIVSITPGVKVVTLDEENRARLAQVRAERAAATEAAVKAKEAQAAAKAEVKKKWEEALHYAENRLKRHYIKHMPSYRDLSSECAHLIS